MARRADAKPQLDTRLRCGLCAHASVRPPSLPFGVRALPCAQMVTGTFPRGMPWRASSSPSWRLAEKLYDGDGALRLETPKTATGAV